MNPIPTTDLINLYTKDHLTLRAIAAITGLSHVAVSKRLRNAGITAKDGERINSLCSFCKRPISVLRMHWKKNKKHFCNSKCYYAYLGQKRDKTIVAKFFPREKE